LDKFLKPYQPEIKGRLEGLTSKKFTKDELIATKEKIKELERDLKAKEKDLIKAKAGFDKLKDPTLARGVGSKKNTVDLFDAEDLTEINGVVIWDGEDPFDKGGENPVEEDE